MALTLEISMSFPNLSRELEDIEKALLSWYRGMPVKQGHSATLTISLTVSYESSSEDTIEKSITLAQKTNAPSQASQETSAVGFVTTSPISPSEREPTEVLPAAAPTLQSYEVWDGVSRWHGKTVF